MSFCCESPIDLGCRSACAPITLPVAITGTAYYTIVYEFAGALISREFEAVPVDGFLQVPSYVFNETQNVTFQIYDGNNVLVSCFKANILPSSMTFEPVTPTPPLLPFTTSINFSSNGCANDVFSGRMEVYLNDLDAIQDGTLIDLHHQILHNGTSTPHSIVCVSPGVTYSNDDVLITNSKLFIASGGILFFDVAVTSKNCNHSFNIDAVVDHVENLSSGYENTINNPMIQFVWP